MNIHTLDLNFQGTAKSIASFLIQGPSGNILIETGPGSTLDTLIFRLSEIGLTPQDIGHVLVTHIHLDHAGAAGWFGQQGARVYVHPVGAPHLINPDRLLHSARRIYGDKLDTLWGDMLPLPEEKITILSDGDEIDVAGLSIKVIDTPGHAYHHHVYAIGDVAFTGDAAGVRIEGSPMVDIPAPPPEFNLEAWLETISRLRSCKFRTLYPTHFGPLPNPEEHLLLLADLLQQATSRIRLLLENGADRSTILADFVAWHKERTIQVGLSASDYARYEVSNPVYMSVDGIVRYWRKMGIPSAKQDSTT